MLFETKTTYVSFQLTDQQVLEGQADGLRGLEDEDEKEKIKWEGVWKQFLAHLSVINMEKEQRGSASPPTSRMLSCFLGRVKKAAS